MCLWYLKLFHLIALKFLKFIILPLGFTSVGLAIGFDVFSFSASAALNGLAFGCDAGVFSFAASAGLIGVACAFAGSGGETFIKETFN